MSGKRIRGTGGELTKRQEEKRGNTGIRKSLIRSDVISRARMSGGRDPGTWYGPEVVPKADAGSGHNTCLPPCLYQ